MVWQEALAKLNPLFSGWKNIYISTNSSALNPELE